MTPLLRTAALIVVAAGLASPVAALDRPGLAAAASAASVNIHRGFGPSIGDGRRGAGHGRFDRRDGDFGRGRGFDGGVYLGDREYQGDTAWRQSGFNDWWHDSPRSTPRWLGSNNCARQYWTGGGWRC